MISAGEPKGMDVREKGPRILCWKAEGDADPSCISSEVKRYDDTVNGVTSATDDKVDYKLTEREQGNFNAFYKIGFAAGFSACSKKFEGNVRKIEQCVKWLREGDSRSVKIGFEGESRTFPEHVKYSRERAIEPPVVAPPLASPDPVGDPDEIDDIPDKFQNGIQDALRAKGVEGDDAKDVQYFAEKLYQVAMVLLPRADRVAKSAAVADQIFGYVKGKINGVGDNSDAAALATLKRAVCGILVAWKGEKLLLIDVSTQLFQDTQLLGAQKELRKLLFEAQRKVSSSFDVSVPVNATKLADAVFDKAAAMARDEKIEDTEEAFAEYLRGLKVTSVTLKGGVLTGIVMKYASVHTVKVQQIAGPKTEEVMAILLKKESYELAEGEDTPELWEDIIRAYGEMVVSFREVLEGQENIETKVQNVLVDLAHRTVAAAKAELEKSRSSEE